MYNNGLQSVWFIYRMHKVITTGKDDKPKTVDVLKQHENILEDYEAVTLDKIKESTTLVKEYSPVWSVWGMTLAREYVINSCDKELREKVQERMKNILEEERCVPTYFKLAIMCMTSMGYAVTKALEMKLTFLKINDFDQGNIIKALQFYQDWYNRL